MHRTYLYVSPFVSIWRACSPMFPTYVFQFTLTCGGSFKLPGSCLADLAPLRFERSVWPGRWRASCRGTLCRGSDSSAATDSSSGGDNCARGSTGSHFRLLGNNININQYQFTIFPQMKCGCQIPRIPALPCISATCPPAASSCCNAILSYDLHLLYNFI